MRCTWIVRLVFLVVYVVLPGIVLAGHTRPGYVDGGQSADGRYVVTAEPPQNTKSPGPWHFTWKDTKSGQTYRGTLVGIPYGLDHFRVAYTHIFVAPGGETFAVWQPASWAPCDRRPPGANDNKLNKNPSETFKNYDGFRDRLVIYKKTGEVIQRLGMNDILKNNEWIYVNWVQGNLYWLTEYPDMMKGGEPPRCGYRYYRISPDYTVLEFTVGPNSDAKHRVKDEGPEVLNYRRVVRVSLTQGTFFSADTLLSAQKLPGRPFVGELVKRGSEGQKNYLPSLDPVRSAGKINPMSQQR